MIHELHKWINIKSIVGFLLIMVLNIFLFRLHTFRQDHLLLDDYSHYLTLLEEQVDNEEKLSSASFFFTDQKEHIAHYPNYIINMPDRARDAYALSGASISTFAQRNIDKTVHDFKGLEQLELEIGRDHQAIRSFSFKFSDFLLVAVIVLVATQLFTQEYEDQIYPLIIASTSRVRIAWNKILSMAFILVFVTFGLFVGNIVMSGAVYGWDHLGRLVQSISEFRSLAYPMTVGTYLVLALTIKWLNGVALGLVILALFTIFKKAVPVLMFIALAWVVALLIYVTIPVNSVWNALHFVNPIHGFDAYNLIRTYRNVNILNYPIEILHLWPAICIIAIMFSSVIIIIQFKRAAVLYSSFSWTRGSKILEAIRKKLDYRNARGGIFSAELKKTLFSGKALLVLLLLIALLYYRVDRSYRFADADRMAYAHYVEIFQGKVSDDTLAGIEAERDSLFADASHDIVKIELAALDRIQDQLENVLEIEEERGVPAFIINDDHYAQWMDNTKADQRDLLFAFMAAILATAGIFARENAINVQILLRITPEHKRVRHYKVCITILISLSMAILLLVARYLEFSKFEQLSNLDAPVQSHRGWSDFQLLWNMRTYLTVMILFRLATSITLGFMIAAISARSKNDSIAVVLASVFMLLPGLAFTVGIREFQMLTLAWVAEANVLLHGPIWTWFWAIFLLVALSLISLHSIKKEWQPQI